MPRLRIVVPAYGVNVVGGTETLARRVAQSLVGAGWNVEVWTSCAVSSVSWANHFRPGTEDDGGVVVRRFAVRRVRRPFLFRQFTRVVFGLPSPLRPERAWINAQGPALPELVRALAEEPAQPTLFSPYLYQPIVDGIPSARGPSILIPGAHDEKPLRLRRVAREVAAVGAILYGTEEERRLLERVHPASRGKPSDIGTIGVEPPPDIDPARFRRHHGIEGPYLLHGGRAGREKGLDQLASAIALVRRRHPHAQVVVTGEAAGAIARVPGVHPVGFLDDGELWDAIAGAAAVVVPSFLESLSLLTLEAWAAGRPAILNAASPVLAGQAERSRGAVTYVGTDGLAAAAAGLLDDPARGDALGAAGRAYVTAHYRWADVHRRLERLIEAAAKATA